MRKTWDEYFMGIAWEVSTRATCDRLHVGCVIVDADRSILATGYNGSVIGGEHCDDAGHDMVNGHCVRTVHAEANAIAQAARRGVVLAGSTAYVTAFPCWGCAKLLKNAGVRRVLFAKAYREDPRVRPAFHGNVFEVKVPSPEDLTEKLAGYERALQEADRATERWRARALENEDRVRRIDPAYRSEP